MSDSTELVQQMQANAPTPAADRPGPAIGDLIKRNVSQLQMAVGSEAGAERLARILLTEVRKNPGLAECTPQSFMGAAMQCAQMRLDPGPLGHCWLVPIPDNKAGVVNVEWWLGYKGMIELAYRSGQLATIHADPVRANDDFDASVGSMGGFRHRYDQWATEDDRGPIVGWYAYARLTNGGERWVTMRPDEIDAVKAGSRGSGSKFSPWNNYYVPMARKTCVRRLFTWLPASVDMAPAVEADGRVSRYEPATGVQIDGLETDAIDWDHDQ